MKTRLAKQIPNVLTISRVAMAPIIIAIYYSNFGLFSKQLSAIIFLIASLTDFLDGYLARFYNVQSDFGRFLDPVADKILVTMVMLMLLDLGKAQLIPAIAIVCREIFVSALREFLANFKLTIPVTILAKLKTIFQMSAIFLLLLGNEASYFPYTEQVGQFTLWLAAILTIVTGFAYFKIGLTHIKFENNNG